MKARLLRGFLAIFGGNLTVKLLTVAFVPILVRFVGSDGYGEYAFVLSTMWLLLIVANSGIFTSVRKFLPEDRDRPDWEQEVFGFYLRLAAVLVALVVAVVAGAIASGFVEVWLGQPFPTYFGLLCLMLVGTQFHSLTRSALMAFGREPASETLHAGQKALFVFLSVAFLVAGWDVAGVLFAYAIASVTVAVAGFGLLARHVSLRGTLGRADADFPRWELLRYNLLTIALIGATFSLYHVDIVLLQTVHGSQETGLYRASLQVAEFLWLVPIVVATVFVHSLSELWSSGQRDLVERISARATRYTLLLTLLFAIGVVALADPFVRLYFGPEFMASVGPLLVLLPGALGFAVARQLFAVGQAKGDLRTLIWATGTAAVLNLGLNLLLIPPFGMWGAAVATSVGYGSMGLLHVRAARTIGFDPLADIRAGRIAATAVGATPVIVGASALIENAVLALVVVPPLGGLVYAAVALKTGAVDAEEVVDVVGHLPPPADRVAAWL